jgi:colicin import membrane protein
MWWSRWRTSPYYRPSLFSLGMHVTLLILLSVSWLWSSTPTTMSMIQSPQVEIIQATAVSEQQYEQEVKEIEQAQQRAQQQETQREQQRVAAEKTAANAAAAEQKRQVEEQQRKVQAEQQKIAEQKLAEEKRIAAEQQKVADEQRKAQEAQAAAEQKKIEDQKKAEEAERLEEQKKIEEAQRLEEQKKAEAEAAAVAQRKAEEERLRQQQLATEQAAVAAQQQAHVAGELNRLDALITQKISSMWIVPVGADPSLEVHLVVRLAPDGSVLSARIQQSSGNGALDQSALDAVYKASPLPVSTDAAVFNEMRTLNITITPQMIL